MQNGGKMAIVLFSGTVDKMMALGMISSGAVAMRMDLNIYLTFWGLQAFAKEAQGMEPKFSGDYADLASMMAQVMKEKSVPSLFDSLRQINKLGNVKIHACTVTMDLLGQTKEDFIDLVDDTIGVGQYVEMAKHADITLFI